MNQQRFFIDLDLIFLSFFIMYTAQESEFEYDGLCDEAKTHEKENALREAILHLAGDFGKESMLSLCRFFCSRREPVISTGSLKLDLALGIGGLPKVRTCTCIRWKMSRTPVFMWLFSCIYFFSDHIKCIVAQVCG